MPPSNETMSEFEVRSASADLIQEIAELHMLVFPEYFLTHMGKNFVARYYQTFTASSDYGFAATNNQKEVIGFLMATSHLGNLMNRFYRENFLFVAATTIYRLLVDSYIRKEVFKRLGHVALAFNSIVPRKRSKLNEAAEYRAKAIDERCSAELMGIGVHPDWRGTGVAEKLVNEYFTQLAKKNIFRSGLTVRVDNGRARRFYEKTGWQVKHIGEESVHYFRSISITDNKTPADHN